MFLFFRILIIFYIHECIILSCAWVTIDRLLDCRLDLFDFCNTRIVNTLNYSAIGNILNLQFTTGRLKSFLSAAILTSPSLVTGQVFFSQAPLQLTKL